MHINIHAFGCKVFADSSNRCGDFSVSVGMKYILVSMKLVRYFTKIS